MAQRPALERYLVTTLTWRATRALVRATGGQHRYAPPHPRDPLITEQGEEVIDPFGRGYRAGRAVGRAWAIGRWVLLIGTAVTLGVLTALAL